MKSWGLALAMVAVPAVARAAPHAVEVGGFVGVDMLPRDVELGNSWASDQVPGSGPSLGGRALWWLLPDLVGLPGDDLTLDLGVEGEVDVVMSSTRGDAAGGRGSYAAPVVGVGAHLIAALTTGTAVTPHLLVGGGGNALFTSSPFARDDVDPIGYWGLGASWQLADRLSLRLDLRHGLEAGRMNDLTSTFAAELGVSTLLGPSASTTLPHVTPHVDDLDVGDTRPGPGDHPIVTPPAPPVDRDGDGIADAADQCPDQAEDKDGFQDADGCPDPDNDGDGIADAADQCPDQAETPNGIDDADGCPETLPPALVALDGPADAVTFAGGKAKLSVAGAKALDKVIAALRAFPTARLRIEGHAGKGVSPDLARRRAEAVKWHLIDAGIAADRLDTATAPAADAKAAARIELHVVGKP